MTELLAAAPMNAASDRNATSALTAASERPWATGTTDLATLRVLVPVGMLGGGFPAETITRGIALGAHAIVVDGGSTDSGPYYLGTATAKTTESAVRQDLHILLTAAVEHQIPLIVTSCGTSGTDSGVDWISDIVDAIAAQKRLSFRLATIRSELHPDMIHDALDAGRITALAPSGPLTHNTIIECSHIVGVLGAEPIAAALDAGALVVLTGRATDTAPVAALALRRGLPAGVAWHAAKTTECGGLCTTNPQAGVLVGIDADGFTIESLDPTSAATPTSVAAHMIYENADPRLMREPSGTLDTTTATYTALDDRRVRVEGSQFHPAEQYTIKLEGAAHTGYETLSLVGIRDPHILAELSSWLHRLNWIIEDRVKALLGLAPADYDLTVRCYGKDAVLGPLEPETGPPREVGVLLKVRAFDQATATAIAKIANPYLLHLPLAGMDHLPSFAFATSPAEIERGASYEFVLNHTVNVSRPDELFRTTISEVVHA
jgi:hypothetical protein